jgi:signal transduction histidine kinase
VLPEEQGRIFERFYRGMRAESEQVFGSGLGLSKAHTIMNAHGGRITLKSSGVPGQGSTFTLWLLSTPAPSEQVLRVGAQAPVVMQAGAVSRPYG